MNGSPARGEQAPEIPFEVSPAPSNVSFFPFPIPLYYDCPPKDASAARSHCEPAREARRVQTPPIQYTQAYAHGLHYGRMPSE